MNRFERAALLTRLVEQMRAQGSWSGETHIQKGTYVLQELLGVQLGLDFLLYKHGPFSFDLREELVSLRADGLLELVPQPPYGPMLQPSASSAALRSRMGEFLSPYMSAIDFVAARLGPKGIFQLEQLSTALYVRRQDPTRSQDDAAAEIRRLKPHISGVEATTAIGELDKLYREARKLGLAQA